MTGGRVDRRVAIALTAGSAAYFAAGLGRTLELVDTGLVLYPSWLTARGAIPYRDYGHMYGPSLFFGNAALLRLFGVDLMVVRTALLVLKTVAVLQVYWLARRVAPPALAVAVAALLVVTWGGPYWLSTTPYAVYYETPLALAGLLLVLRRPPLERAAAATAGLLFGLAATFKQTAGAFGFAAIALYVLAGTAGAQDDLAAPSPRGRLVGLLRAAVLLGVLAVSAAGLGSRLVGSSGVALGLPVAIAVGLLLARDVAGWGRAVQRDGLLTLTCAFAGMVLPLVAYAAFYLVVGGGARAVFETLHGLPQRVTWFVAIEPPGAVPLLAAAASAAVVVASVRRAPAVVRLVSLALGLLAGAALARSLAAGGGLLAYVAGRAWYGDSLRVFAWLPIALVWSCVVPALRHGGPAAALALFAAMNALQLYPAADVAHTALIAPTFLPLAAYAASGLVVGRGWRVRMRAAVVTAVLAGLAAPFVDAFVRAIVAPPGVATVARATGIRPEHPQTTDAAALLEHLAAPESPPGPLFVLSGDSLLYVLADRDSVFPAEEFLLYLVGTGTVTPEAIHDLVDEQQMIARLDAQRPLVVDYEGAAASARVRRALPALSAAVDARYRPLGSFGRYRLLGWSAG